MGSWLRSIEQANESFRKRVSSAALPIERPPGKFAVVTCMDPRVNLEAIGIERFRDDGGLGSATRVIRTLGARCEPRSLVVGIHLAGIQEIAVLTHTDCGAMAAWNRASVLLENLRSNLGDKFDRLSAEMGGSTVEALRSWLRAFDDPKAAAIEEVDRLRREAYVPADMPIHGLVLDLATAHVTVAVDGYAAR